jgi:hypothetical protein
MCLSTSSTRAVVGLGWLSRRLPAAGSSRYSAQDVALAGEPILGRPGDAV